MLTFLALALIQQSGGSLSPEQPLSNHPLLVAGEKAAGLKFDDLFPRRSFFGKTARSLEWSKDDKHLLYLWNPYEDRGVDLYVYDAETGKSRRLTSIELMAAYDRDIPKAVEQIKKDKEEEAKLEKLTDLEYREYKLKKKEEDEKRKEPLASYPGISEAEWNPKAEELLFTYKGDVYRWVLSQPKPSRLTRTRESEAQIKYLPDGSGYTFRRGSGVFRQKFGSEVLEQLNPELPNGLPLQGYSISPDGTKLMVTSSRSTGPDRSVDWITYRDRFATAQKVQRGVADDEFKSESFIFLYDLNGDALEDAKGDGKAWEVWKWPGGKEWMETAVSENPWSPDSKKFVFGSWRRNARELEITVANVEAKKLDVIYKGKSDGEHTTPGLADPFFTGDGSKIIALLDLTGFRHVWALDPVTGQASPVTKGEYEAYPVSGTPDGKSLFVTANKEHPAYQDIYRVDLATGEQKRLTRRSGTYGTPVISESGKQIAATFQAWTSPVETYVWRDGNESALTDSHRGTFGKVSIAQPKLFDYKNRHGQTVNGYMFLPSGFKKSDKRPLMIYVYGGPLGRGNSVAGSSFNSSAYLFNLYLTEVLGFVTVTIDPRGSSGYGSLFGRANYEQVGKPQVEDLSDGAKHLVENYGVDPKKVAINGWSFGGFQTQMCLYTAPEVFTLGIAGAGPTEWQNYNTWYSGGTVGPSPNGKPEDLDKYSLTKLAKNLRSPLLLLHGIEDTNVLFQDTVKVYRKLLQYGKGPLVELALDPTGGHGLGGDIDARDRHAIYLSFILKHWFSGV